MASAQVKPGNASPAADTRQDAGLWKKTVMRRVYQHRITTKTGSHITQEQEGPLLSKLFYDAANQGQINAYAADDMAFSKPLNKDKMDMLERNKPDTEIYTNPRTGAEEIRLKKNEFDFNLVNSFYVLEYWTYNPTTSLTSIQIQAIAPVLHIYGDEGTYRGTRLLFWVKWSDARPILKKYNAYDPANNIGHLVWNTYFRDSSIAADSVRCAIDSNNGTVWTRSALRTISQYPDIPADGERNLEPRDSDMILSQILYNQVVTKKLKSYKSFCDHYHYMTGRELSKMTAPKYDTQILVDPVTGDEVPKILTRTFNLDLPEYQVKELWKFDMENGRTEITYLQLAPVAFHYGDDGRFVYKWPLLMLNYDEARPVLRDYAEHNPDNNIELLLWNTRFKEKFRLTDRELSVEYK